MRIGAVVLPTEPWPETRRCVEGLEAMGVSTLWIYDHLRWGGLPTGPWYGAWPVLAAAAAVTSRLRLGPLVTSANLRHPVTLAQEVMTLDAISQGRVELGVGAGSSGPDATVLGGEAPDPAERARRFEDFVSLLDELLRATVTTRRTATFAAAGARLEPGCVQRPRVPFAVAASGRRGMALAARHGQRWVTLGRPGSRGDHLDDLDALAAEVARQCRELEETCEAAGRDPADLERVLLHMGTTGGPLADVEAVRDFLGTYAGLGFAEVVLHVPRRSPPFEGDPELFEAVAAGAADP